MITTYQREIIEAVIINDEGGWTLSYDPDGGDGGWTFAGVTANTFHDWCKEYSKIMATTWQYYNVTKEFVYEHMHTDTFKHIILRIYKEKFMGADDIIIVNQHFSTGFLSCKVLCSRVEGVKLLQGALNIKVDGVLGPETRAAIIDANKETQSRFCLFWMHHLIDICKHNPAKIQYLSGWYNRVYRYDV